MSLNFISAAVRRTANVINSNICLKVFLSNPKINHPFIIRLNAASPKYATVLLIVKNVGFIDVFAAMIADVILASL